MRGYHPGYYVLSNADSPADPPADHNDNNLEFFDNVYEAVADFEYTSDLYRCGRVYLLHVNEEGEMRVLEKSKKLWP